MKPFDPFWLVSAAADHYSDEPWLQVALSKFTRTHGGKFHVYFVLPGLGPNKPSPEWQFVTNRILEDTVYGDVVSDVFTDNRIDSVEFLDWGLSCVNLNHSRAAQKLAIAPVDALALSVRSYSGTHQARQTVPRSVLTQVERRTWFYLSAP